MRKDKPKVSTKGNSTSSKQKKIIGFMKYHPEGVSPMFLSCETRINVNTVKSILKKLELNGKVRKDENIRGFYYLVENPTHSIYSYNLHNVILKVKSGKVNVVQRIVEKNSLNSLIKFRFEVGKNTNQATMHVSTDYPFNFSSLGILTHLFQQYVEKYCGFVPELDEIELATIEINKDYEYCRLEKIKSLTVGHAISEFKLYQKDKCVREEFKTKVPIGLGLIDRLLRQGAVSAEIYERQSSLEKVAVELKNNYNQLQRFSHNVFRILMEMKKERNVSKETYF